MLPEPRTITYLIEECGQKYLCVLVLEPAHQFQRFRVDDLNLARLASESSAMILKDMQSTGLREDADNR